MKSIKHLLLLTFGLAVFTASCADLTVENLNSPDTQRALNSKADLENLAANLYRSFYAETYDTPSPVHSFSVVADVNTCSWGNYGMRATSSEPRTAWDNTVAFPYENVTSSFFDEMYAILSSASNVLRAMDNGVDFGASAPMIEAWSKFNQAIVLSNIALTFDQGYIITEDTPDAELIDPVLKPYTDIAAKAEELFDEAIALADANTFTMPDAYINGVTGDNALLSEMANTYAARLLAYLPRTAAENATVNWAKVRTYAMSGLSSDLMILMDDENWLNDYQWVMAYPGWGRTDMRLVNMMDSSYPEHNTNGDDFAAPDSARIADNADVDDRLWSDYEHLPSNNFRPERGLYHFSSFRNSRYDEYISEWTTAIPEILKAENDMLLAEAELELGNVGTAAAILNDPANSRKARGGLPDVAATAADVSAAIHHERMIEMPITSYGLQYFDMRKRDLLQEDSFLQLPLPAKTLELLQYEKPYYTFGGSNPSSSTGGWN
jgi:hypothetical protein